MSSERQSNPQSVSARVAVPDHVRYQGSLPTTVESPTVARRRQLRSRLATGAFAVLLAVTIGYVVHGVKGGGGRGGDPSGAGPAGTGAGPTSAGAGRSLTPAEAAPSGMLMPVGDMPGWRQTFADDFADGIGNPPRWHIYDGLPGEGATSRFNPEHVSAGNGLLTVAASRVDNSNGVFLTGGLCNSNVFSQTYGRYEVRFRVDKGNGIAYAIRLLPTSELALPQIDVLEGNGTGTDTAAAIVRDDAQSTPVSRKVNGDFTAWHTATVEWTTTQLVYRLDGAVWATMKAPNLPTTPMSVTIRTYVPRCAGDSGCPNASTPERVNLYVDWVVAYTATG